MSQREICPLLGVCCQLWLFPTADDTSYLARPTKGVAWQGVVGQIRDALGFPVSQQIKIPFRECFWRAEFDIGLRISRCCRRLGLFSCKKNTCQKLPKQNPISKVFRPFFCLSPREKIWRIFCPRQKRQANWKTGGHPAFERIFQTILQMKNVAEQAKFGVCGHSILHVPF